MRRADRLFQIVQYLRGGRLVTAAQLSNWLEVSERTIYRDIADLQANGVPIDGERGVGYILRSGFDLPPLMFTPDEIVSIVAGARLVRAWGGQTMADAAREALVKVEAVLPEKDRDRINRIQIHAAEDQLSENSRSLIDGFSSAIDAKKVIDICYIDLKEAVTSRRIRPLGLWYWGKVWTVLAWCELRDDFRLFRVDRVSTFSDSGEFFLHEKGKMVRDFEDRHCP